MGRHCDILKSFHDSFVFELERGLDALSSGNVEKRVHAALNGVSARGKPAFEVYSISVLIIFTNVGEDRTELELPEVDADGDALTRDAAGTAEKQPKSDEGRDVEAFDRV